MHDSASEKSTQSAFDFDALSNQPVDVVLHVNPAPQEQKHWWSDLEHRTIPHKSGVYAIINQRTQHFYVGSSVDLLKRKREHFRTLKADEHRNLYLQRAYNHYGVSNFIFCIIEYVSDKADLTTREQHYIDNLRPEYNFVPTAGSNLGMKHSSETKEKLRTANLGKKHTEESKAKRSAVHKGRKKSPDAIEKTASARRGSKHTDEAKEKNRLAHLGNKMSPATIAKREATRKARREAGMYAPIEYPEETRAKMRNSHLGKKPSSESIAKREEMKRAKREAGEYAPVKISEETRAKLRESHLGKKLSPESVAKRLATLKAKREALLAEQQSSQPPLI